MTTNQPIDPEAIRASVDAISAQIAAHNAAAARQSTECAAKGDSLKKLLAELARDKPAALGEYLERTTSDFRILYDQSGHISGYQTSGGPLSLFTVDHADKDLQQYIAALTNKSVESCRSRSR